MIDDPRKEALAAAAAELDAVAARSDGFHELDDAVRAAVRAATGSTDGTDEDRPELPWFQDALDAVAYRLRVGDRNTDFEPFMILADGTTDPVRVPDQPDDRIGGWARLHAATTHQALRARLAHLVVHADRVVTGKARVDLADAAAADYLATPTDWGMGLDHADALLAAAGLAKQFGLRARRDEALRAITRAARLELDQDQPGAGMVLGLTHYLVLQNDAPPAVDDLLIAARETWAANVHNLDDVIAQQIVRAGPDPVRKAALTAERVQAWLDAAAADGGVRRAVFLQTAVQHAAASGDAALRRTATERLQELTLDDLGMTSFRTGLILRGEQVADAIRPITDATGWQDALDRWALTGPPTGDAAENRKAADEHVKTSISAIFPHVMYGGDGLPRFEPKTDDERADYFLTQQETLHLQLKSQLVTEALLRIPAAHGLPSLDELAAYFARNPLVSTRLAYSLARAFHRWWAGDHEGAALAAAARTETLARELLLAKNHPLYRLQREQKPGQYPGLGYLLSTLADEGLLTDSWHRYLRTALAGPAGWNLRNELDHGFLDDVGAIEAAVMLQCAAHLAVIPLVLKASAEAARTPDDAVPAQPDGEGGPTDPPIDDAGSPGAT